VHWALRGPDASERGRTVAKERFSYPLRPRLARSGMRDTARESWAVDSGSPQREGWHQREILSGLQWIPGSMLRIAPE